MIEVNYDPYDEKGDKVPQSIKEAILKEDPYFDEIESGKFKLRNVKSPFILADNAFDLRESNNTMIEIGVDRVKSVQFTGGNYYIEFAKKSEQAIIVHGNDEEGFNIFILS